MVNKLVLTCTNCLQRNYVFYRNKWNSDLNLEIKKFCKHCNKRTIHRQSR